MKKDIHTYFDLSYASYLVLPRSVLQSMSEEWQCKGHLHGNILDYGCGHGEDVEILRRQGYSIEGYDKYYQPDEPSKQYDVIMCNYVLNVIP